MKKILIIVVVIVVVLIGVFLYTTRPASAPSQDIISQVSAPTSTTAVRGDVYKIDQKRSVVTFKVDEILRGKPFTAVGTTSQVAGEISVTKGTGTVPNITFGTLVVNARTFKTDSAQRDGAIARFILKSETPVNEFIKFVPGTASGLTINADKSFSFNLAGDITISGITKPLVFAIKASIVNGELHVTATTTVKRSDFGLVIPSVSFVANVGDVVSVTADIVLVNAT